MSIFIDAGFESLNRSGEELCGDKVEIIRDNDSLIAVLADGLGSGVKANILATLTSKIIGTMLSEGAKIDEAVETIAKTLPVCRERGIAYSTFSILQVFHSGEGYLVEFDNPAVLKLKKGRLSHVERQEREINGKVIRESRFMVEQDDLFVMISDGVVHAGIGGILNLGWQWDNVAEYIERIYNQKQTAKTIAKQLLAACENLYMKKPGDDATVVAVKIRKPLKANVMVGPPVDRENDNVMVRRFMDEEGKKIVCGGTTSQILSRELGTEIITNFDYFNPAIPPTAEIKGIDLTTEGVLTLGKTVEYAGNYVSSMSTMQDILNLNKQDGASRLARLLIEDSTSVHFFVGRAMNPAHQNPELPLNLSLKLKLVEELSECLISMGKEVIIDYY